MTRYRRQVMISRALQCGNSSVNRCINLRFLLIRKPVIRLTDMHKFQSCYDIRPIASDRLSARTWYRKFQVAITHSLTGLRLFSLNMSSITRCVAPLANTLCGRSCISKTAFVHHGGGLAQLVATLVGSTKLLYAGPG